MAQEAQESQIAAWVRVQNFSHIFIRRTVPYFPTHFTRNILLLAQMNWLQEDGSKRESERVGRVEIFLAEEFN